MGRMADESVKIKITAADLHAHDAIVCKNGDILAVLETRTRGESTTVTPWTGAAYTVASTYPVTVLAEHSCWCSGRGIFRGGGVVENGVYKGYEGVCYSCGGKGWQDRQDVIRCATYWNKYARISA